MRLAHISDIHILDLEGLRPWHLNPKRATGAINLLIGRSRAHAKEPVEQALREIEELDVDHIVVTGDLTNLATDSEFEAARRILSKVGDGRRLSVIPGNHDTYTRGVVKARRFEHYFEPWMQSDLPRAEGATYPYVKLFDGVALVGISTCIPTAPLFATGEVGAPQLAALAELLEHPEVRQRFVVAAFHHHVMPPPKVKRRSEWMRQLKDADGLLDTLKRGGVGLGIHGHTHQHSLTSHLHPGGADTFLHVAAAGSTSVVRHHDEIKAGKYNVYEIGESGENRPVLNTIATYLYSDDLKRFDAWKLRTFQDQR